MHSLVLALILSVLNDNQADNYHLGYNVVCVFSLTQEGEEPDGGDDGEGAGVVEGRRVGVGVGHRLPAVDGDHRHRERAHQDVRT